MTAVLDAPTETEAPGTLDVTELEHLLDDELRCMVLNRPGKGDGPCGDLATWLLIGGCGCRFPYCDVCHDHSAMLAEPIERHEGHPCPYYCRQHGWYPVRWVKL